MFYKKICLVSMMMKKDNLVSIVLTPKLRYQQALKDAGVKDLTMITHLKIAGAFTDKDEEYMVKNLAKTYKRSHGKIEG